MSASARPRSSSRVIWAHSARILPSGIAEGFDAGGRAGELVLSPLRGWIVGRLNPQLALWALLWRRCAADQEQTEDREIPPKPQRTRRNTEENPKTQRNTGGSRGSGDWPIIPVFGEADSEVIHSFPLVGGIGVGPERGGNGGGEGAGALDEAGRSDLGNRSETRWRDGSCD